MAQRNAQNTSFWNYPAIRKDTTLPNQPIQLLNQSGGIINGYQPSIIRPIDNVRIPKDITYGDGTTMSCNGPCYTGSKYQQWCNEDNAINYHAMRPLINSDQYTMLLYELFDTITDKTLPYNKLSDNNYAFVFCQNTQQSIIKWLMEKIMEGVVRIPGMKRNGPWKYEQFHYTDVKMWNYKDNSGMYYKLVFNLYNPLRSVSTLVKAVVYIGPNSQNQYKLVSIGLVNQYDWKMTGETNIDGIQGFNLAGSGRNQQINVGVEIEPPTPTVPEWNYKNTLLEQEFNQYGFYENGNNVKIEGGVPNSLKNAINNIEQNASSYLYGCAKPAFTGTKPTYRFLNGEAGTNGEIDFHKRKLTDVSGNIQNVYDNPSIVFGVKLPQNISNGQIPNNPVPLDYQQSSSKNQHAYSAIGLVDT